MNKFSIFMTHQQNYANDRLGIFAFSNLFRFIQCWTNLRLKWIFPEELAGLYFEQFPKEKKLLWTNPCTDPRHRKMLVNDTCAEQKLPNIIIIGPQKTGTTALAMFLKLHPNVSTNNPIPHSYEELQFFAGPNYGKGLEWYAEKFSNLSGEILCEKTANYFDNPTAPEAVHSLLPNAKLVVILSDPVQRAYSWYQHMKAHNDSIALKYSADEIFMGNFSDVERIRKRALWPGLFAQHVDNWLDYFPPTQLIIIDGDRLRTEPHFVLRDLFVQLNLTPLDGLGNKLKFSQEKGFYCVVKDGRNVKNPLKCLGQSKGRHYEPMSIRLRHYLETYFAGPNLALKKLLRKYKFPVPSFLISA